jgi:HK97 family phage major capsid protein
MASVTTLANVGSQLLPSTITAPIFQKATEQSAVMQLARQVPLSMSATTTIPVMMDIPTAGWVSEGGVKPVGTSAVGVKNMQGKKVALLLPVSDELVATNPSGLYDQLVRDLPTAIARAFDTAAISGKDLKTGGAGPFADYLTRTPNSQVIGSSAANAGGVYADLWKGVSQVVNAPCLRLRLHRFRG